jgi:penicillin-binding protein 1A
VADSSTPPPFGKGPKKDGPPSRGGLGPVRQFFLDLDARLNAALYAFWAWLRGLWDDYSTFMDRFHVSGFRRFAVEGMSEAATLGTCGAVLMLALAIPAFNETTDEDWLKRSELAVTFLDRYGNRIGERGIRHNDSVPLEEMPDHLIKAVLATEDRRFYEHFGIDLAGTLRALTTNVRAGGVLQGGSSITQQLAKNLFLSNERTIERKVKEAFLAIWLESRLKKNEILKLYLDRAYLGGGSYGVDAAAQFYFAKSARDVSLAEAAMLAGLFKAPTRFAPHVNLPAARARASTVLDNLVEAGFMTEGQVFGARRNPARAVDRREEQTPNYYLDYAFREVQQIAAKLPPSVIERVFVVRTAFDPAIQKTADDAIESSLRQFGRDYNANQAAIVVMEVNGALRAMVGGRDYGESQFNRATDALRQPGSSFKPFVYATAFLNGMTGKTMVLDGPICLGNWCPQNYSRSYFGNMPISQALTLSLNTPAVRIAGIVGRNKIVDLARKMGLTTELRISAPLPLGAAEVTVFDMTQAYATFASNGKRVRGHASLEIRSQTGELIWRDVTDLTRAEQVLPVSVIDEINPILVNVVENGTARRAILNGILSGGKTGTTNAYRDAWFIGFTGNFVAAVWYGNDDYQPLRRMTGGSLPAMTWHRVMEVAHQGVKLNPMPGVNRPAPKRDAPQVAQNQQNPAITRPAILPPRAIDQLLKLERAFRDAAGNASLPHNSGQTAANQPTR